MIEAALDCFTDMNLKIQAGSNKILRFLNEALVLLEKGPNDDWR